MELDTLFEALETIGHAIDGKQILAIRKERLERIISEGIKEGLSAQKIANNVDRKSYKDTHWNTDRSILTIKL